MYAYFLAVALTFLVWSLFFLMSRRSRKEMVLIGLLLTPFVALDALTTPSYWTPITVFNIPVGIEGFLFTFFIAGIAAVVYEIVFRKDYDGKHIHFSLFMALAIPALLSGFAVYFLSLNIIYLFIIGFVLMALTELISRRDLLLNSVFSSVLFSVIYIAAFTTWLYLSPESASWWNVENLSNIRLGVVPVEEILFCVSLGLFVGPLYEYLTAGKLIPHRKAYVRNKYRLRKR